MTGLPEFFKQTSDDPYLRHDYKLIFTNKKPMIFDNYEDFHRTWFQTPNQFLSHGEILDYKERKSKRQTKGFK